MFLNHGNGVINFRIICDNWASLLNEMKLITGDSGDCAALQPGVMLAGWKESHQIVFNIYYTPLNYRLYIYDIQLARCIQTRTFLFQKNDSSWFRIIVGTFVSEPTRKGFDYLIIFDEICCLNMVKSLV